MQEAPGTAGFPDTEGFWSKRSPPGLTGAQTRKATWRRTGPLEATGTSTCEGARTPQGRPDPGSLRPGLRQQELRDHHGVERGAAQQLVGDDP